MNYAENLRKCIPSNVVALSVSAEGAINMASSLGVQQALSWVVFAVLVIGLPFYMLYYEKKSIWPVIFGVFAYIILEFSLGGPFAKTWPNASGDIKAVGGVLALFFAVAVGIYSSVTSSK